jgi:hypothetical protein
MFSDLVSTRIQRESIRRASATLPIMFIFVIGVLSSYKSFVVYERALLPIKVDFQYGTGTYKKDTLSNNTRNGFFFEKWHMKRTDVSEDHVSSKFLQEVIKDHQLISGEEAFQLLRVIADKDLQTYDADIDLLIFDHPMKTGGTSISDTLENIFPEQVIPGSDRSGFFHQQTAYKASEIAMRNGTHAQWLRQQKVVFSHTSFYDRQGKMSILRSFLQSTFPDTRRFRILTMVSKRIVI